MKTDVVIPLATGSRWDDNEIRFCLRSLEKNFVDLKNIIIVGYKPSFLKDVIHLKFNDTFKQNKDANIIGKVKFACELGHLFDEEYKISESFLRLSDDQVLLKPFSSDNFPMYFNEGMEKRIEEWSDNPRNRWKMRFVNTRNLLKERGKETLNYDLHLPAMVNREMFIKIFNSVEFQIENGGYIINSLYFNFISPKNKRQIVKGQKITFEGNSVLSDINENTEFIGYNDNGLNQELKDWLLSRFPNKSRFEI